MEWFKVKNVPHSQGHFSFFLISKSVRHASHHMEILRDFQVVVGTYEEFLLGFQVTSEKKGPPLLHPTFSDHAHAGGAVRAIGAEGKFLASGAADENVRIVNLRKRTHHGDLRNLHQDTVTQIVFYDRAHLVTAADDGKIW